MKKIPWKTILLIASVGIVAFVIWEIIKAIQAGEKDLNSLIKAPWNALKSIWSSITGLFSSKPSAPPSSAAPPVSNADTSGISTPATTLGGSPTAITDQTALASLLLPSTSTPTVASTINATQYPVLAEMFS